MQILNEINSSRFLFGQVLCFLLAKNKSWMEKELRFMEEVLQLINEELLELQKAKSKLQKGVHFSEFIFFETFPSEQDIQGTLIVFDIIEVVCSSLSPLSVVFRYLMRKIINTQK